MPAKHLLAGAPGARLPLRRAYAAMLLDRVGAGGRDGRAHGYFVWDVGHGGRLFRRRQLAGRAVMAMLRDHAFAGAAARGSVPVRLLYSARTEG